MLCCNLVNGGGGFHEWVSSEKQFYGWIVKIVGVTSAEGLPSVSLVNWLREIEEEKMPC